MRGPVAEFVGALTARLSPGRISPWGFMSLRCTAFCSRASTRQAAIVHRTSPFSCSWRWATRADRNERASLECGGRSAGRPHRGVRPRQHDRTGPVGRVLLVYTPAQRWRVGTRPRRADGQDHPVAGAAGDRPAGSRARESAGIQPRQGWSSVARSLVDAHFPSTVARDVLVDAGLDPDQVYASETAAATSAGTRRRSVGWRLDVLEAWDRQCASSAGSTVCSQERPVGLRKRPTCAGSTMRARTTSTTGLPCARYITSFWIVASWV